MKLANADLLNLVPWHIAQDPQFAAAGEALRPYLARLAKAIPNLLIYNRLGKAAPSGFLPPLRRLTEAAGGLSPLSDEILEALAWQFHVDFREAAQTRAQLAGMVRESIAWHRIKGTPASMQAALSLFNFGGIHIDEFDPGMHWASYQLGFDEVASLDDLKSILKICQEMQPARCRLWRVYTSDYDYRPGVWSGPLPHNAWGVSWWSGYSGTYFPELPGLDDRGLLVSFALRKKFLCEPWALEHCLGMALTSLFSAQIPLFGYPVWSVSRWSELFPPRLPFSFTQVIPLHGCEYIYEPESPWYAAPWQPRLWAISRRWDRRHPPFRIFNAGIPLAQGCWSEDIYKGSRRGHPLKDTAWQHASWRKGDWAKVKTGGWSGTNAFWGTREILITAQAPKWGCAKWSDLLPEPVYKRIDEFFYDYFVGAGAGFFPAVPDFRSIRSEIQPLHGRMWRNEPWGARPWGGAYSLALQILGWRLPHYLVNPWPNGLWAETPWTQDASLHAANAIWAGIALLVAALNSPAPMPLAVASIWGQRLALNLADFLCGQTQLAGIHARLNLQDLQTFGAALLAGGIKAESRKALITRRDHSAKRLPAADCWPGGTWSNALWSAASRPHVFGLQCLVYKYPASSGRKIQTFGGGEQVFTIPLQVKNPLPVCQLAGHAAQAQTRGAWQGGQWPATGWRHCPRLAVVQIAGGQLAPSIKAPACSRMDWAAVRTEKAGVTPVPVSGQLMALFAANAPRIPEWQNGAWPDYGWGKTLAYKREQQTFGINVISEHLEA